jgi:hypothetical protein
VESSRVKRGERAVRPDCPDHLGMRTQLGGEQDWSQDPEFPACAECNSEMTCVAQIDSIEHDGKHDPMRRPALGEQDWMFGDAGMIYVFLLLPVRDDAIRLPVPRIARERAGAPRLEPTTAAVAAQRRTHDSLLEERVRAWATTRSPASVDDR